MGDFLLRSRFLSVYVHLIREHVIHTGTKIKERFENLNLNIIYYKMNLIHFIYYYFA